MVTLCLALVLVVTGTMPTAYAKDFVQGERNPLNNKLVFEIKEHVTPLDKDYNLKSEDKVFVAKLHKEQRFFKDFKQNTIPSNLWEAEFHLKFSKEELNHMFPMNDDNFKGALIAVELGSDVEAKIKKNNFQSTDYVKKDRTKIQLGVKSFLWIPNEYFKDKQEWVEGEFYLDEMVHMKNDKADDGVVDEAGVYMYRSSTLNAYTLGANIDYKGSISHLRFHNPRVLGENAEKEQGEKHPYANIAGSTVKVVGVVRGDGTLDVRWLSIVEKGQYETSDKEQYLNPYTIYGTTTKTSKQEEYRGSMYQVMYLRTFDDEVYKMYYKRGDSRMIVNANYQVEVVDMVRTSEGKAVEVLSYTEMDNNLNVKIDSVVSITGTLHEKDSVSTSGIAIHSFDSDGVVYKALFDKSMMKQDFGKLSKGMKEIELTGVTSMINGHVYITVIAYRELNVASNLGSEGYIKGTFTKLISRQAEGDLYEFITYNGELITIAVTKKSKLGLLIGKSGTVHYKGVGKKRYALSFEEEYLSETYTGVVTAETDISSGTTVTLKFKTIEGRVMKVVLNRGSYNALGGASGGLVGKHLQLTGKMINIKNEMVLEVFGAVIVDSKVATTNIKGNLSASFRGKVYKEVSRTSQSITVLAKNQYGQSEKLIFSFEFTKENSKRIELSLKYLMQSEISITGYRLKTGEIMVEDFGFQKVPTERPDERKPMWESPEYFPNMNGWEGMLDISDLGGEEGQIMLIVKNDKYILNGKKEVMALLEKNLRKMVYLRGEYREAGAPYWTGEIKVYDIQPLGVDGNTITKPKGEEVHDRVPPPDKDAIHTLQFHDDPKKFDWGSGIPEALYFPEEPEIPQTKDDGIPQMKDEYKK